MKSHLSYITILMMSILTIGVFSSQSITLLSSDVSLFNNVFAQEPEQVFIAPNSADQNNEEGDSCHQK
ncbi:MAG TPA: hypothetical protein VFK40_05400 [Nitrososphaeraceae archaeon]|nr:hypothetical protein [Nitrososphaeraceae archaeon]